MRHDSGHNSGQDFVGNEIPSSVYVSNSILFVWYNIYIVSVWCMFRIVSSSFLSTLHTSINRPAHWICHTRLMVNPHISRSIRYHPHHTRQAFTILYHYYSWPPSIRGSRTVDWWNERCMTHKNIHHVFPPCGQTSTSTKQPSIRVPICAVLILIFIIMTSHPLPSSSTRVRWQYQIRYTLFNWQYHEVSYFAGGH